MLTEKHIKAIAGIIKPCVLVSKARKDGAQTSNIAYGLANYFATQNPKFDRQKFLDACGL